MDRQYNEEMRAIKAEECQVEEHNLRMLLMREQLKYYQNQNNKFEFSVPNKHANVVSSGLSQILVGSGLNNSAANNVPSMHSECIPSNEVIIPFSLEVGIMQMT